MTSADGITWTSRTAASVGYWHSVAAGDGYFMAIAAIGGLMVSTDASTWVTLAGANAGSNWEAITYGANKFVGVANTGNILVVRAEIPATTTTTTTTVAPTTTTVAQATTTVAPATTVAPVTTVATTIASTNLPATGSSNNNVIAFAALITIAGLALALRRRNTSDLV